MQNGSFEPFMTLMTREAEGAVYYWIMKSGEESVIETSPACKREGLLAEDKESALFMA